MSDYNPYQASPAASSPPAYAASGGGISPTVISHLSRTKPWVQFLGVLGMIFAVLGLIMSLFSMVGMSAAGQAIKSQPNAVDFPVGFMVAFGGFGVLISLFYLFVSIKLFGYGSAIGTLRYTGQVADLELALDRQRSVWKSIGLVMVISIVLWLLMVVGMVIFGATMAQQMNKNLRTPPITAPPLPGE